MSSTREDRGRTMSKAKEIPLRELSRYFRVPAGGIPVDYPGREVLLKSRITNISQNGVFIHTQSPFAPGATIDISFRLPTLDRAIRASCVVRWSTALSAEGRHLDYKLDGMGLEFSKIGRPDRKAIADYIADYLMRIRNA